MTGFALLAFLGMIISATIEGAYIGSDATNIFYRAMNPTFGSNLNVLTAIAGFFMLAWVYVQALWAVFTWDYSFLEGSWEILRVGGWAVSMAMVVSLVLAMRGTGSA